MRFLDQYDVLAVAARVLRCESEDAVRRTDLDAVDRVLTDVRRASGLAEAAGVLLAGLIQGRAFRGANRVVTVAVVLQFVAVNHADLRLEPVGDWDDLLDRVAADQATPAEIAGFLRDRLTPDRVTAEDLREHLRAELLIEDANLRGPGDELLWKGAGMFERFDDAARRAVVLAQEEARQLGHDFIGTEHLLLGVIHEEHGGGAKVLTEPPHTSRSSWARPTGMGITVQAVRDLVVEIVGCGKGQGSSGTIPFTPRAKATLEHAYHQARRLGAEQLGTEHLLLGLLDDGDGVAAQILRKLGADLDDVRRRVQDWIDHRRRIESAVSGFLTDDASTEWSTFGRRHHLLHELNAVLDENERLHEQVAELRALLRRHNIDPDS
ncbi:Clp protease N-terminal domain-containing protein [Kribbella swartbergensis]